MKKRIKNNEPEWMAELDKQYEEKFLETWGDDEDFVKIKQLKNEISFAEHESTIEIVQKTATFMELTLKFYKKMKASRPKTYIKLS